MIEVAFHLNVPDVGAYACRLLRKAYAKGARVRVLAEPALLDELDRRLWLIGPSDFVPHATDSSPQRIRVRSPVLLGAEPSEGASPQVLVNLSPQMPADLQGFDRVIDVVGTDESDRQRARARWRAYRDAGLNPEAIDIAARQDG